jgi:hypothetical protein
MPLFLISSGCPLSRLPFRSRWKWHLGWNALLTTSENKKRRIIVFFVVTEHTISRLQRVSKFLAIRFHFIFFRLVTEHTISRLQRVPFFCVLHPFFGPRHRRHYFLPPEALFFSCFIFYFLCVFFTLFAIFDFFCFIHWPTAAVVSRPYISKK